MTSYRIFDELQRVFPSRELPHHGIKTRMANFFFDSPIEEKLGDYQKMKEIESITDVNNRLFPLAVPS